MNKYTDKQIELLNILQKHKSKEESISKSDLIDILGCSERKIRAMVEDLRYEYCICSSSDNNAGGYWIGTTREDAEAFVREMVSRAKAIFTSTKGAKNLISEELDKEIYGKTIQELLEETSTKVMVESVNNHEIRKATE